MPWCSNASLVLVTKNKDFRMVINHDICGFGKANIKSDLVGALSVCEAWK